MSGKGPFVKTLTLLVCLFHSIILLSGCNRQPEAMQTPPVGRRQNRQTSQKPGSPGTNQSINVQSADSVRPPAVAGLFYPADPRELTVMIKGFLTEARASSALSDSSSHILGILVPHAGYIYSGITAAYGFAALEGRKLDTVFLIGSPHRVPVSGASVYSGGAFDTPLGRVPVNVDVAKRLVASSDRITDDESSHIHEHSLEVELPFLQTVLGTEFSIVPVLVMGGKRILEHVANAIAETVSQAGLELTRTLFVISSDLSHYPRKEDAIKYDSRILDAFCRLNGNTLLEKNAEIMTARVRNLSCTMCGLDAAYVGIRIANAFGGARAKVLHASVSSDAGIPGTNENQVVGYGAVAIMTDP